MRFDNRLSRVLHVLLHLDQMEGPTSSELISKMLKTNPAVVRRIMAGLREQGYVLSSKGHHGGWILTKPLSEITLLGLYQALGSPNLFAIGHADDTPTCLMELIANKALDQAMKQAEEKFIDVLSQVNMASLASEFTTLTGTIGCSEEQVLTCREE
jgi:Rrf2 family protein